uniref:Putative integron gene cassette protein n=1 Tax=Magnetococcus massalia (strain MO-1) TaxID=451514 RepID=A0A1S7LGK0_MAGMO|nr:putative integron gene cassette protein [Candidatus Magnetococcus massalia]
MYNPPHPGEILHEDIFKALNITIKDAAEHLKVSRKPLSDICNGKAAIRAELAMRLEQAFGAPGAASWLQMQAAHDLWEISQNDAMVNVGEYKQSA